MKRGRAILAILFLVAAVVAVGSRGQQGSPDLNRRVFRMDTASPTGIGRGTEGLREAGPAARRQGRTEGTETFVLGQCLLRFA
jgi:hypothetical protein